MEYRKLPHGKHEEKLSVLGLGMGGIQKCSNAEIEQVIRTAVANGINFFDLCAGGKNVYEPFGRAITGQRDKVFFQIHFGAVYNKNGDDVGLVNKYYDLALAGDAMAANHYEKLRVKADACIGCGHCDKRCPFHTAQSERMKEIAAYFEK